MQLVQPSKILEHILQVAVLARASANWGYVAKISMSIQLLWPSSPKESTPWPQQEEKQE